MPVLNSQYFNNSTKLINNDTLLEAIAIATVARSITTKILHKSGQVDMEGFIKEEFKNFFDSLPMVIRTNNKKQIGDMLKRINKNVDKAWELSQEDIFVERLGTTIDKATDLFTNLVELTAKKVKVLTNINKIDKELEGNYIHKTRIQYNFGGHLWLFQYDDGGINPKSAVYYVDGHPSPALSESHELIKSFLNLLSVRAARKLAEVFLKKEARKRSTVVEYAKRMADILNLKEYDDFLLVSAMALNVVHSGDASKLSAGMLHTEVEKVLDESVLIKDVLVKSDIIDLFISSAR